MPSKDLLEYENAERILAEGWVLFQQKGYRGVSVDELCARCGLSKPTLYYYFHDKENLFVQVLIHKLQGFHQAIEQPGSLPLRLQHVALNILDNFQTDYTTLIHDREHIHNPEHLMAIRDAFRAELFGPLMDIMRTGIASGELTREDPETLTLIFLGMVNNFIGKAAEMHTNHPTLAGKLAGYFLQGVKNH